MSAHRTRVLFSQHEGDCDGTLCDVCGCCQHCIYGDCGCAMATVTTPFELTCPGVGCDCTGGGAPVTPQDPDRAEPLELEDVDDTAADDYPLPDYAQAEAEPW